MSASKDFARVADIYDATRGGAERGERHAAMVAPHLREGDLVLEVAIGTGVVAAPLIERGFTVVGADLSIEMLLRAVDRVGPRVIACDAARLPFPNGSVDAVVSVWTLHVVGDRDGMVAECARVLAPGGRWIVVPAQRFEPSEMQEIMQRMHESIGSAQRFNGPQTIAWLDATVSAHGLAPVEHVAMPPRDSRPTLPRELAEAVERRIYTPLWDLTDEQWQAHVVPALQALRSLPDQDRPRIDTVVDLAGVYEKT